MTVVKKCETCEQRWVVETYVGFPVVKEITISHETAETVVQFEDRGTFGASTRRRQKVTNHESLHKTELEAWQKAAEQLLFKAQIAEHQLDKFRAKLLEAQTKVEELGKQAG